MQNPRTAKPLGQMVPWGWKRSRWLLSGQPVWARGWRSQRGPCSRIWRWEREQRKQQSKRASTVQENKLPPSNKQSNREQGENKTREEPFLVKMSCWDDGAGSVSQLGRFSLYNALVKKGWWTAGSNWNLQNGSDPWWWTALAPLPWQTAGSSSGSIAELYRAQREQRELLMSISCFKRDPASLPCRKHKNT